MPDRLETGQDAWVLSPTCVAPNHDQPAVQLLPERAYSQRNNLMAVSE